MGNGKPHHNPVAALERHLIFTLRPIQGGRIRKILTCLDFLIGLKLSARPNVVIGSRAQGFYILPQVREIDDAISSFYRYATEKEIARLNELLTAREAVVVELPRRGKHRQFSLNMRIGRLVFGLH